MAYSNFHNHTTYCDGKNTAEEMVLGAIERGYRAFGISEHSYTTVPFDKGNLTAESMPLYFTEMQKLREKYANKIEILIGIEQDALGGLPTTGADYVIGSTHFVCPNGEYRYVDDGTDGQIETVTSIYGGDWNAFAEEYFRLESQVALITNCNIVGHFDLINKNNAGDRLFDTAHPRYRAAAIDAMSELLKSCNVFEVNTGAMYRVGNTNPYPAPWLLRELLARGGEVILSGDSHNTESLGYKFPEMEELLRAVGFKHRKTLTRSGFVDIAL